MEAAGLALAVFPLVVKALSETAEAVNTIERLVNYSKELARYSRNMAREEVFYKDTLTELLDGITETDDDLGELLQDPGGALWNRADYDNRLATRLGRSYKTYLETIGELVGALERIQKKLSISLSPGSFQTKDKLSRLLDIRRLKLAFNKKEYEESFVTIQRLNYFLRETTKQNLLFEEKRRGGRPVATVLFKRIAKHRRNLRSLRRALENPSSWLCQCSPRHKVELSVENLKAVCLGKDSQHERQRINIMFPGQSLRVVEVESSEHEAREPASASAIEGPVQMVQLNLSTRDIPMRLSSEGPPAGNLQRGRATGTRVVTFSTPRASDIVLSNCPIDQPAPALINCICSALSSLRQAQEGVCIGHIVEDTPSGFRHNMYHIKTKAPDNLNLSTMEDLLVVHSEQLSASRVPFSRRARLAAATCLALSVLLLDGSWLRQKWSLADFVIDKDSSVHVVTNGTIFAEDEIYLPISANPGPHSESDDRRMSEAMKDLRVRCAPLFMLGISLIQLSLGSPMSKLGFSPGVDETDVRVNLKTATNLLPRVIDESDLAYGDVVRRCLDCPFDSSDLSLDQPLFQEFVYEKIVSPLLADFQTFQQA